VVGFTDRVRMMNVFSTSSSTKGLKPYNTIAIKACREIKFSNGGHLFACASQSNINVYKFYTGENNNDMIYKAHLGPVRCLNWLDDDSGFISGGWDGNVYAWKFKVDKHNEKDQLPHLYPPFTLKNF
jgi:WD40 repeat protein